MPLSAEQADYFILLNPADFTIANSYEQTLDAEDAKKLGNGVPFRLMAKDVVLGDQISHAARLELLGKTFTLAKNENGSFVGDDGTSKTVVKNATVIGDTIVLTEGSSATVVSPLGESRVVPAGTTLIRIFSSGSKWYVALRGSPMLFGWCSQLPGSTWRKGVSGTSQKSSGTNGLSDELQQKIIARFTNANETYTTFFDHFNEQSGSQKTIPRWTWRVEGKTMRVTLNQPYARTGELDGSTEYVVRDIENLLLGTSLRVLYDNGELLVQPKAFLRSGE